MPRPTNKTLLLEAIEIEYAKLEKELNSLSADQQQAASSPTSWSPKDIIAHLHEWSSMVHGWYEAGLRDEVPHLPAPGYKWSQIPAINEQIYWQYRDLSWDEVMALFIDSRDKIWATIRAVSNADMFTPSQYKWTGKNAMGTYFVSATSSHYVWARKEIRKWIRNNPVLV